MLREYTFLSVEMPVPENKLKRNIKYCLKTVFKNRRQMLDLSSNFSNKNKTVVAIL